MLISPAKTLLSFYSIIIYKLHNLVLYTFNLCFCVVLKCVGMRKLPIKIFSHVPYYTFKLSVCSFQFSPLRHSFLFLRDVCACNHFLILQFDHISFYWVLLKSCLICGSYHWSFMAAMIILCVPYRSFTFWLCVVIFLSLILFILLFKIRHLLHDIFFLFFL